jgi:serine/threonine protein kinase
MSLDVSLDEQFPEESREGPVRKKLKGELEKVPASKPLFQKKGTKAEAAALRVIQTKQPEQSQVAPMDVERPLVRARRRGVRKQAGVQPVVAAAVKTVLPLAEHAQPLSLQDVLNMLSKGETVSSVCKKLRQTEDPNCQEIAAHLLKYRTPEKVASYIKALMDCDKWIAERQDHPPFIDQKGIEAFLGADVLSSHVQEFSKALAASTNSAYKACADEFKEAYGANEEALPERRKSAQEILKDVYARVKTITIDKSDIQSENYINTLHKALIYLSFERTEEEKSAILNQLHGNKLFRQDIQPANREKEPVAQVRALWRKMVSLDCLLGELKRKVADFTLGSVERFLHRERIYKHTGDVRTFGRLKALIDASGRAELAPLKKVKTHKALVKAMAAARQAGYHEIDTMLVPKHLSSDDLDKILKIGPSDQQVDKILGKIDQHVADRYRQLVQATQLGFEEEAPAARDLLAIANYVEHHIRDAQKVDRVFRQRETGLTRTLQLSKEGKLFVIAGEKSKLHGGGSFKKIASAVGIALDNYVDTFKGARSYTRASEVSPQTLRETREEMKIATELGREEGFVRCHTYCEYTFGGVPRISMVAEAYEGTVEAKLKKEQKKLTIGAKIGLAQTIVNGIAYLHKTGRIQGDLKLDNVLWRVGKDRPFALIDFGFVRKVVPTKSGEFQTLDCGHYDRGYYGSIYYTSPELWGVKDFSGDPMKVESFAVGYVLWQAFYGAPPWQEEISNAYDKNESVTQERREALQETIRTAINAKRKSEKFGTRKFEDLKTDTERMKWIMLELLNQDPKTRLTAIQAATKIAPPEQRVKKRGR